MENGKAASNGKTPSNPSSRRFLWLAVFIVGLIVAYSGVWFYLAGQLKDRSRFLISDLQNQNVTADCRDMDVRGYPFRLGVFCSAVVAQDGVTDATVSTGSFRSAAQIYKPNHIVSELDGPATIEAGTGLLANMDWEVLRSSTVFNLSGLDRASLESKKLLAGVTFAQGAGPLQITADSTELHARQNDADLDAVLRLNTATLSFGQNSGEIPGFDLQADVTLADRAWLLAGGAGQSGEPWRNLSASLNNLNADLENGAGLSIDGPFSINESGYLTGKFNLEIRGMKAWQEFIATAFPDLPPEVSNATGMVASIGSKQDSLSLPINIDNGTVRIGFIQIGKIPPL